MYARMVIGQTVSDEQLREFKRIYEIDLVHAIEQEPGYLKQSLLIEEDGCMAVSLTVWSTRQDCLRFNSSRAYRQFVRKTQHLLVGEFVVKLFSEVSASTVEAKANLI